MSSTKARNGKVDLLKFIFSLVVIIYHFGNAVKYDNELFNRGYIAVEFFFIVSGFLFAKSLSRIEYKEDTVITDSLRFMGKKYKSFMPYHLFLVVLSFIFLIHRFHWSFTEFVTSFINAIPDILLVQMGIAKKLDMLGHEWYISAMLIAMFIMTPFALKYGKKFTRFAAPVLSLLTLGYLYRTFDGSIDLVYNKAGIFNAGLLRAFAELTLGCVCYEVCTSGLLEKANKWLLMAAETAIYILLLIYADNRLQGISPYVIVLLLACAVTISFSDRTSVKAFNNKFVLFLGKLSFPVYLMQILVRQVVAKLDWSYGYASQLALFTVAELALSLITILVMDNVMKLIDKRGGSPAKKKKR